MARYKVLSSIAHNVAQGWTRPSHADDQYLLNDLLGEARKAREPTLSVDLFTGEVKPPALASRAVTRAMARWAHGLPDLVAGHHSDMQYVKAARMEMTFDLAVERKASDGSGRTEVPFVCRVEIDDDRGNAWKGELSGWAAAGRTWTGMLGRLIGRA